MTRSDICVVGAGPAGLIAAMQARRHGLSVTTIAPDRPGGFLRTAFQVENFPGFPNPVLGKLIAERMMNQAANFGVTITEDRIVSLEKKVATFHLAGLAGNYQARAVIVATGSKPRQLLVPGVKETSGTWLFYRADHLLEHIPAPASVLVIGGGEAAFDQALMVASIGAQTTIALRGNTPRALPGQILDAQKAMIRIKPEHQLISLEKRSEIIAARFHTPQSEIELKATAILVNIGKEADPGLLPAAALGPEGLPDADLSGGTAMPGLFVAGDLMRGSHRQAAIAAGDGMAAALAAAAYLER